MPSKKERHAAVEEELARRNRMAEAKAVAQAGEVEWGELAQLSDEVLTHLVRLGARPKSVRVGGVSECFAFGIDWPAEELRSSPERLRTLMLDTGEIDLSEEPGEDRLPHRCGDFKFITDTPGAFWDGWQDEFTGVDPQRMFPIGSDSAYFLMVGDNPDSPGDPLLLRVDHDEVGEPPYRNPGATVGRFLATLERANPRESDLSHQPSPPGKQLLQRIARASSRGGVRMIRSNFARPPKSSGFSAEGESVARTFDELGIRFPLFGGPVEDATGYEGVATCSLCAREGHCFTLGIGADVIAECPKCGTANCVSADDREGECGSCERPLAVGDDGELRACYACLRAGKAALTKDTVFGMVRWEDAVRGETHGVPGPRRTQEPARVFQVGAGGAVMLSGTAPAPSRNSDDEGDEAWIRTKLEPSWMYELLRTPAYSTWQGEAWQFHDNVPMVYVGTWGRRQFAEHAADGDGERFFRELVESPPSGSWTDWLGEDSTDHGITVYVFRSQDGRVFKAHFDMD